MGQSLSLIDTKHPNYKTVSSTPESDKAPSTPSQGDGVHFFANCPSQLTNKCALIQTGIGLVGVISCSIFLHISIKTASNPLQTRDIVNIIVLSACLLLATLLIPVSLYNAFKSPSKQPLQPPASTGASTLPERINDL